MSTKRDHRFSIDFAISLFCIMLHNIMQIKISKICEGHVLKVKGDKSGNIY